MWPKCLGAVLLLAIVSCSATEDTSAPVIPSYLIDCYRNQSVYHRENRIPMTLSNFIELIRKIEKSPSGLNLNAREIAGSLLYYLRMDGIQPAPQFIDDDESVVPFAPVGKEFIKHGLMLKLLIAPPQQSFTYIQNILTPKEICNLHFMLSYSIDATKRVDENCGNFQPEPYQKRKFYKRSTENNNKEAEDVNAQIESVPMEILAAVDKNATQKVDVQVIKTAQPVKKSQQRIIPNVERSQCPVENGVVFTPFGSVTIGTVIAGITAGLQRQMIRPRDLGVQPSEVRDDLKNDLIDNVWASTLSGELANVILAVGDLGQSVNNAVGLKGGFNNTIQPKWYILQTDNPAYVTDAQLRGALDGLWLGTVVSNMVKTTNSLKLSHILDMYYSKQGIIGTSCQACNRRPKFSEYAPEATLSKQVELYSTILQKWGTNSATIVNFQSLVLSTTSNVKAYVPTFDSGSQCSDNTNNADQISSYTDSYNNILVIIDNSWPDDSLKNILNSLIDKEAVSSSFSSNTTFMCGADGNIIFNSSSSVDFMNNFTTDVLNQCADGLDFATTLYDAEVFFRSWYDKEKSVGKINKGSYIALFLPYSQSSAKNIESIWSRKNTFNTSFSDVKFLVGTNGPKDSFSSLVDDINEDVVIIPQSNPTDSTFITQISVLAKRIKSVPQHISNPKCGSNYEYDEKATGIQGTLTDDVRLGFTKYYRIHPNYLYEVDEAPIVNVRALKSASLTVCLSRTDPHPVGSSSDLSPSDQTPGFNNNNNNPNNNLPNNDNPITKNTGYGASIGGVYNRGGYNPSSAGQGGYNPSSAGRAGYNPSTAGRGGYNPSSAGRGGYSGWGGSSSTSGSRGKRSAYGFGRQIDGTTDSQCLSISQTKTKLLIPDDPCSEYSYIKDCPPIYISITVPLPDSVPPSTCTDCRLPSNAEYEISVEQLTCKSTATDIIINPITMLLTSLVLLFTTKFI